MFYHFFTVEITASYTPDVILDAFFSTDLPDEHVSEAVAVARQFDPAYKAEVERAVAGMRMRAQFNNTPAGNAVYVVTNPVELDREDISDLIQLKKEEGQLEAFLSQAALAN